MLSDNTVPLCVAPKPGPLTSEDGKRYLCATCLRWHKAESAQHVKAY